MSERMSLDLARKLREHGYPRENIHWFYKKISGKFKLCYEGEIKISNNVWGDEIECEFEPYNGDIAAPCGCQILEQLPWSFENENGSTFYLVVYKPGKVYVVGYQEEEGEAVIEYREDESLAEACGELYCWLKTEGYL